MFSGLSPQGLTEKMGSNFLVAAFIPSLAFAMIAMVVFSPILPPGPVTRLTNTLTPLGQPGLLLVVFTIVLGFTLSSLNTFIYKLFEGYVILERFGVARQQAKNRAQNRRQPSSSRPMASFRLATVVGRCLFWSNSYWLWSRCHRSACYRCRYNWKSHLLGLFGYTNSTF